MTWRTSEVAVCCSSDFGEFARAPLLGFKQPCVLDCDYRLVSEGFEKLDLFVLKWSDIPARH